MIKEALKSIGQGLILLSFIILYVVVYQPDKWTFIMFLAFVQLISSVYFTLLQKKTVWNFIIRYSKGVLLTAILINVIYWLYNFGVWGYSISILLVVGYIIVMRWSAFLDVKWQIESMLFGKPLKDYIKDGEKPPSLGLKK